MKHITQVTQTPAKAQDIFNPDKGPGVAGKVELGSWVAWAGGIIENFTGFRVLPTTNNPF